MNKDPKVSNIQIRGLIVSTVVGVGVLSLPSSLAHIVGRSGWMVIIISGLLMVPLLIVINQIFKDYPGKDFFEIGKLTLGNFIFTICLVIMLAYFVVFLSFVVRNLGELIKAFLLPTTPLEIIILTFILATSYIACYEIDVITRAGYFIYPMILIFALIVVLISLPKSDFTNLLPVFPVDLKFFPKGISAALFSFAGFEMILFALPYVEERENTINSSILAIGTVTAIYLSIFIMTLSHFSIEQIQRQTFSVLVLAKLVDLPGYFLENLDGLVMAIWVIVVFGTMAPAYFAAGKVLSKLFKTKSHKYFIWALVPVIYWVSLLPQNAVQVSSTMGRYFNILAIISIVIVPLLIFFTGYIRRKVKG